MIASIGNLGMLPDLSVVSDGTTGALTDLWNDCLAVKGQVFQANDDEGKVGGRCHSVAVVLKLDVFRVPLVPEVSQGFVSFNDSIGFVVFHPYGYVFHASEAWVGFYVGFVRDNVWAGTKAMIELSCIWLFAHTLHPCIWIPDGKYR